MKTIWILLAFIGFTLSEKLDRTYLPPPGSKFSGGSPGAIDVPLENSYDKFISDLGNSNFGKPEIAIGIDRIGPIEITEKYGTSPPYQQNRNSISMTESYAYPETRRPDVSLHENYTSANSIDYPYLGLKDDHKVLYKTSSPTLEPENVYSSIQKKQEFDDDNTLSNIPNGKNQVINVKISDERENSFDGTIDGIPEINSYVAEPYSTSSPDHTLLNNYETGPNIHHSTSSLLPNNVQNDSNYISSTPTYDFSSNSPKSSYSSKLSQYTPIPDINIKTHLTSRPERIRAQTDREAVILNYDNKITPDGYAYSFDTSNGIHVQEEGTELNGIRATGSYSYIGDDGKLYNVSYTADENGFRPYGAHLPTAPPIPEAILKVIEKAAKDREAGIYDDGTYDENKYGYKKYNPDNKTRFLNKYKTDGSEYIKQRPYVPKLRDNGGVIKSENEKILTTKKEMGINFFGNDLLNISPNNMSSNYDNQSKGNKHDYKVNEFQNNLLDKNIQDSKKTDDMLISKDTYETEYQNVKPHKDISFITEDKFANRISEIPSLNSVEIMYKTVNDSNSAKPFMTPYVYQNDNTYLDYDNDDSFLNIPGGSQESTKIEENDQNTIVNFPAFEISKTEPTSNINKDDTGISIQSFNDQGYYYPRKEYDFNNYIYNPFEISKQTNLPEDSSTTSKEITSRINLMETDAENISIKPSAYDFSVAHDKTQTPNSLLGVENELKSLPTNSPINHFEDFAGPTKKTSDIGFLDNGENSIKGEYFSGPKQKQKYDPLNGYYY